MKVKTKALLIVGFVLVLTGFIVGLRLGIPGVGGLRLGSERSVASSDALLYEIRDLFRLSTVQYVHKTVFPFDYQDPRISLDAILAVLRAGTGSVDSLLTPAQRDYLEATNLAVDLGLLRNRAHTGFVVVTAVVRAGFDLSGTALDPKADPALARKAVRVTPPSPAGSAVPARNRITIVLPPATVTELRIEDPTRATYPYPDVDLRPEQWKRVAAFVEARIRPTIEAAGVLEEARRIGESTLRRFLLEAGFDEVDFE